MPLCLLARQNKSIYLWRLKIANSTESTIAGRGWAVKPTFKFIQVIYCEYKLDGSRVRVSRVSNFIAEWKRSYYLEQAHSPLLGSLFRSLPLDDILLSLLTRRSWLPLLELCSSWSNSIGTTIGRARVSNKAGIFIKLYDVVGGWRFLCKLLIKI